MDPLRAAIIGCGGIANRHAERLAGLADVHLVGFCDRVAERAIAYNQRYAEDHAQVYEDYERMYEALDLDLVYICLPPFAHGREVELACQRGIHLFIEKPIALTLALAESMARWVEESGVKAQVGFMYRHGDAVRWLKQTMQDAGAKRGFLTARYFCNSLHSEWWRDRSKSGGQVVEQIIHLFDLARFLLGEPARTPP